MDLLSDKFFSLIRIVAIVSHFSPSMTMKLSSNFSEIPSQNIKHFNAVFWLHVIKTMEKNHCDFFLLCLCINKLLHLLPCIYQRNVLNFLKFNSNLDFSCQLKIRLWLFAFISLFIWHLEVLLCDTAAKTSALLC